MLTGKRDLRAKPLPPDTRPARGFAARAIGSLVPKLTAQAFSRYGFHSAEILTAWPRIAGAELAAITAPERIRWPRGDTAVDEPTGSAATLILRTEPAHALDVEYRAPEIVDRINRYFGYRAVAELKIVQAPLRDPCGLTAELPKARASAGVAAGKSVPASAGDSAPDIAAGLSGLAASIRRSGGPRD